MSAVRKLNETQLRKLWTCPSDTALNLTTDSGVEDSDTKNNGFLKTIVKNKVVQFKSNHSLRQPLRAAGNY